VLEYCIPVWHYALTKGQTEQLEAIQKRAILIILNFSRGMPYILMLTAANLTTLASRREEISKKNFLHITEPTSCLHHRRRVSVRPFVCLCVCLSHSGIV